jgi:cytoskeletal protein CcmA (bactofilin family)
MAYTQASQAISDKRIGSVLGVNSYSSGAIRCGGGIKLDGRHNGSILNHGKADSIVWQTSASVIEGDIVGHIVYIEGHVIGHVYANEIHVLDGAKVEGDLHGFSVNINKHSEVIGLQDGLPRPDEYIKKAAHIFSVWGQAK